ncbi:hypothetical protein M2480_001663 [Parabacteroides sp. PFB2-12]|uniref:hypothetical protein n=1 Tax=unclassified Parabacteroides TaxID=2649774 RepID=UPI002473B642|nr:MULTISPECIES: hypothetical protein [unclassified Parabacteroides]MDH6342345.1 hypothetical protein [Parabacteroides sp. PM6-13]MDH6390688.1 hypothetical protein [Parabacteroides sp. PFB2-12]
MKKIKMLGVAMMAAVVMMLTSCLGDTNTVTQGYGFGVIKSGAMFRPVAQMYGWWPVYATGLETLMTGDCVWLNFEYDTADPNNANIETNGYAYVTLLTEPVVLDKGSFNPVAPNFDEALPNEIALQYGAYGLGSAQYFAAVDDYLFLTPVFTGKEEQKNSWHLYYDPSAEPYMKDGINIYTFYVRGILETEGKGSDKDVADICPFYTYTYLTQINDKEADASHSQFGLEFKYVKEFDEETGAPVWAEVTDFIRFKAQKAAQ